MAKILIKNGRVWDGENFVFADVLADGNTVTTFKYHEYKKFEENDRYYLLFK